MNLLYCFCSVIESPTTATRCPSLSTGAGFGSSSARRATASSRTANAIKHFKRMISPLFLIYPSGTFTYTHVEERLGRSIALRRTLARRRTHRPADVPLSARAEEDVD